MVRGRSHEERAEEQRGFTPEESAEIHKKAKKIKKKKTKKNKEDK